MSPTTSAGGVLLLAEEFLDQTETPESLTHRMKDFLLAVRNQEVCAADRVGETLKVEDLRDQNTWAFTVYGASTQWVYGSILLRHNDKARQGLMGFGELLEYALNSREQANPVVRDRFNDATTTCDWQCEVCGQRFIQSRDLDRHQTTQHAHLYG